MSLNSESIVVQDSEPIAALVDGEVVMLSERAGAYFGLNGIGSQIWNSISQPRRLGEICQSLQELYEVDLATLTDEVTAFLEELLARKLVRVVDRPETVSNDP